jgi:2'-5' RNA ligase
VAETFESALVILVPEVERLIGPFRDRYDPSASRGVPAHITISYPFQPANRENPERIHTALRELFLGYSPFEFSLIEPRCFPDVLYLALDPASRFVELIEAVLERFPDARLYGGEFEGIVPHLTVAYAEGEHLLARIRRELDEVSRSELPLRSRADRVHLFDNREGVWQMRQTFKLLGKG